jgi:CDP-diacylglycerol--serine O-phosphatidyltransferase
MVMTPRSHVTFTNGAARLRQAAAWIPNAFTLLGLCGGITAIRFASDQQWAVSLGCLALAGVCDMLDGWSARALNAQSDFGAQLDSLADLVSFGAAPAMIVYAWSSSSAACGWPAVLFFTACSALRLARFNSEARARPRGAGSRFFVGLPAPGAAGLAVLPLLLSLQFGDLAVFRHPALNIGLLVLVGLLMISRLPTISLKGLAAWQGKGRVLAVLLPLFLLLALGGPWAAASAGGLLYAISLPLGPALARDRAPART